MNGDFYRAAPRKHRLRGALGRLFSRRARTISILLAAVAVSYLVFDNKGIVRRVQLELRERELTEEIARAKEETKVLQAQLEAVEQDKKMIETLARERYGMAREGETVYRVKKD